MMPRIRKTEEVMEHPETEANWLVTFQWHDGQSYTIEAGSEREAFMAEDLLTEDGIGGVH